MKNPETLIIGGSGYFGHDIVRELALEKHKILATYLSRKAKPDQELAGVKWKKLNVCDDISVGNFFKGSKEFKFNNLVYCPSAPIEFVRVSSLSWRDIDKLIQVQVRGLCNIWRHLIESRHPISSVAVIGSACLFGKPPSHLAGYVVAKYALLGLVRSMSVELARDNIRINMISPGSSGEGISSYYPSVLKKGIQSNTPMKRLVTCEDVSKLVKFFLSNESEYLTGLNVPVDGGLSFS